MPPIASARSRNPGFSASNASASAFARHGVATVQADHLGIGAVQIHDVAAAGLGMEQVDVLGDHTGNHAGVFERGQRAVARIGQRGVHMAPAEVVARPVPLPKHRVGGELADCHRVARRRVRPAVVGNPGVGGHPRAGQHRHPAALQRGDEFGGFHASRIVSSGTRPRERSRRSCFAASSSAPLRPVRRRCVRPHRAAPPPGSGGRRRPARCRGCIAQSPAR